MHPPSSVCEALYRKHPQLRLAWEGRPGKELNSGTFGIVQLYHIQDCGDIGDPNTFREYWNVTSQIGESGLVERVKTDRGPIFDRHGGTSLDYDPLFRIPIYVIGLNEQFSFPWGDRIRNIRDTMNGAFLEALDYWMTPIQPRIVDNRKSLEDDLRTRSEDLGGEMTDRLWYEANKTGETSPITAYKHEKKNLARYDHWAQNDRLGDLYGVPK